MGNILILFDMDEEFRYDRSEPEGPEWNPSEHDQLGRRSSITSNTSSQAEGAASSSHLDMDERYHLGRPSESSGIGTNEYAGPRSRRSSIESKVTDPGAERLWRAIERSGTQPFTVQNRTDGITERWYLTGDGSRDESKVSMQRQQSTC